MSDLNPSDAELVQALLREAKPLALLYDRYALRLARYLERHGATEELALDATQEVFARLLVSRRQVRLADDGSLWPWLAVTGRNLLRDWQRRGAVEARARHRLGLEAASDALEDPLNRDESDRLGRRMRLALTRLSPEQQQLVTARVIEEREYPEIAGAVGASETSVRRRVSRGLRAMQTFLQGGN